MSDDVLDGVYNREVLVFVLDREFNFVLFGFKI